MNSDTLADIEEIKKLKARYFRLLDTQQWSEWGQVFAEDVWFRYGPNDEDLVEGRDEVVKLVSRELEGARTVHHGHMPEIEITAEGKASGIWAMFDIVDHPAYLLRGHGHYEEEYVKTDGVWRIKKLTLTRLRLESSAKSA